MQLYKLINDAKRLEFPKDLVQFIVIVMELLLHLLAPDTLTKVGIF